VGLTSPATLVVSALLAIAAPVACLLMWNRLGRRPWLRVSARATLLLLCQASAVLLVGLLVNNEYAFYTSWSELFGKPTLTSSEALVPSRRVDRVYAHQLRAAFRRGKGVVIPWVIPGRSSGLPALPAFVYLPAAYGNPAARATLFPVVELLDGVPGTPRTWLGPLRLKSILDARIASGQSLPFIAVMPTQNVELPRDTQCVNVVGGPKVDTYLTEDVHQSVIAGLRASPGQSGWALMGYSTGGYCAVNLAMRHPDLFSAAVSLSGYAQPATDHSVGDLFGHSVAVRNHNTPLWEAAHWGRDNLSVLAIASRRDGPSFRDTVRLAAEVHAPLRMSTILLGAGGHNAGLWTAMEPVAFNWLSHELTAPLAGIVIEGKFRPTPIVASRITGGSARLSRGRPGHGGRSGAHPTARQSTGGRSPHPK
jgi:enterochelin esterase-like enzyme